VTKDCGPELPLQYKTIVLLVPAKLLHNPAGFRTGIMASV
jgi:hypothetical protein